MLDVGIRYVLCFFKTIPQVKGWRYWLYKQLSCLRQQQCRHTVMSFGPGSVEGCHWEKNKSSIFIISHPECRVKMVLGHRWKIYTHCAEDANISVHFPNLFVIFIFFIQNSNWVAKTTLIRNAPIFFAKFAPCLIETERTQVHVTEGIPTHVANNISISRSLYFLSCEHPSVIMNSRQLVFYRLIAIVNTGNHLVIHYDGRPRHVEYMRNVELRYTPGRQHGPHTAMSLAQPTSDLRKANYDAWWWETCYSYVTCMLRRLTSNSNSNVFSKTCSKKLKLRIIARYEGNPPVTSNAMSSFH